jgi:glycosyltransferase involved in cell wall biosynthesis
MPDTNKGRNGHELVRSVHITNCYHKESGGISTSYNNLLAAAEKRQRHLSLIVPGESESVEVLGDYTKIYYVPAKRSPVFDRRYRVMMPWQYMASDSIIRKILLTEKPDIIEVTDKYTLSLLGPMIRTNNFRRLGRPMLVHFSCERMDDNIATFLPGGRFGKALSSFVLRNYHLPAFDFHIANSEYTAAEFYEAVDTKGRMSKWFMNRSWNLFRAPILPIEKRIHVCPRGVNIQKFNEDSRSVEMRRELCSRAGVPDDAVLLFYAGRLSPEKNVGLLLDLMVKMSKDKDRDYRLLIAGDGPKSRWLATRADKLIPGKIIQFGHLDKQQLANLYANTDVFIHPNPREPFGIAPLEAMASGLPLVAPNSGGILSYANDDNAWLVKPTAEAFANAIRDVLVNDEERTKKIGNAMAAVAQNTSEISANRLLDTYDKLYEMYVSERHMFAAATSKVRFNFAEVVKIAMIAAVTYLLQYFDMLPDPAAYFFR